MTHDTHRSYRVVAFVAVVALLTPLAFAPVFARAEDEVPATEPASVVVTGDSEAVSDSENKINTNVVNDETDEDAAAHDLDVETENIATTTSVASTTAETGDNAADGGNGTAVVATGDAYASANSINVVNANIIDSAGLLYFKDFFWSIGIDLRDLGLSYFTDEDAPTENLDISIENVATTTSAVTAIANTGNNTATSTEGDAVVMTGNAYASGNSVNLVNTDIIDSNYLLVGVNAFGDMMDDITLPSADFFGRLLERTRSLARGDVTTANTATVSATTEAVAETGDNSATSTEGDTVVATGDALASATSINNVNTTAVGDSRVYFLFRIWGDWNGSVRGLPEGMSWRETPLGVEISTDDGSPAVLDSTHANGVVDAEITNDADVSSDVQVYALTGDNKASSTKGDSVVATGNAYASANSFNMVNTNLIGINWIYAIFNIFGSFSGDIAFGHPDMWVGVSAEATNPTLAETDVTFHFTVANQGDAVANGVRLTPSTKDNMIHFSSEEDGGGWSLGDFAPGEVKDFSYVARTGVVPAGRSEEAPLTVEVTSEETDNNQRDNTDHLSIVVTHPLFGTGSDAGFSSDPRFTVVKAANETATTTPATVDYTIDITNDGGPAFDAYAIDTLRDPNGEILSTQRFDLDTIENQDEIHATYSVVFDEGTTPGTYTNTVTVYGTMHYAEGPGATPLTPVSANASIVILPPTSGAPVCEEYLTSYIEPGIENDSTEVERLQQFLIYDQAEHDVVVNGIYDDATIAAVERFQEKYADDILTPWGYNRPTGLVYYTTRKKINDIYCNGLRTFGLSSDQLTEIKETNTIITATITEVTRTSGELSDEEQHAEEDTSIDDTILNGEEGGEVDETMPVLPEGVKVGMAEPTIEPDTTSGLRVWLGKFIQSQKLLLASVFNAFTSVTGRITIR